MHLFHLGDIHEGINLRREFVLEEPFIGVVPFVSMLLGHCIMIIAGLCLSYISLKKLVVKRPVQHVPGIPANPPKPEESKRKQSSTPKSPTPEEGKRKFSTPKSPTTKSPVMLRKERKKSNAPETTGRRPVSIVLEPDTLQIKGGVQQSLSEPIMQSVGIF